jgi:hypothetical protein
MLKRISLLAMVLLLSTLSHAQSRFQFGPKVGANLGKIEGAGFSDNYTLGYHAGGFFDIGFNQKWSIMGELLFNQLNSDTARGFNAIYNNFTRQDFQNPQLNYLSIPLLLSFKPGKLLSFHAGAQYGILIDKSKDVIANGESAFKNGDLSVLAGVQLHLLGFRIYGRYAVGLNNINDLSDSKEWKTSAIQLGLALELF